MPTRDWDMKLKTLLTQKRKAILDRWLSMIIKTYPADAARFMKQANNQFGNPVGHTIANEIETLFDGLVGDADIKAIKSSLDLINKIRAVQEFTASRAVAYIFFLKTAIREEFSDQPVEGRNVDEMLSLESQIDGMALLAFDSYMQCREKLFEIKCNDIKRQARLFDGANNRSSTRGSKV
jgi:hypothetical protein